MINTGADILLLNGEIVFEGDTLSTVSDEDNVKQQAYLRLLTDLGESEFFNDYGTLIHTNLAKPYTTEQAQKVESQARASLLRVGDAGGGKGWINNILECKLLQTEVEGKSAKMIYVKYVLQDDIQPKEMTIQI